MNKTEVQTPVLIGAQEVAAILGVKTSTAYSVIRKLNAQLEAHGKVTVRGKINKRYLLKMVGYQEAS